MVCSTFLVLSFLLKTAVLLRYQNFDGVFNFSRFIAFTEDSNFIEVLKGQRSRRQTPAPLPDVGCERERYGSVSCSRNLLYGNRLCLCFEHRGSSRLFRNPDNILYVFFRFAFYRVCFDSCAAYCVNRVIESVYKEPDISDAVERNASVVPFSAEHTKSDRRHVVL